MAPRDPEELEAAGAPARALLAPSTTVGAVHLTVADLDRSIEQAVCGLPARRELHVKPSVGLEPTTPSLPWKDGSVSSVHGRSPAGTKCLQSPEV